MPFLGKSGSDAIAIGFKKMCRVIAKYHTKLDAAIDQAEADGKITSDQATAAHLFVDSATVTCDIFILVAGNSGFGGV